MSGGGAWPRRGPGDPPWVLAHRGGSGPWRENTLDAFAGALGAGADGVELDVRRSADGQLVVHHDPDVPGLGGIHRRRADELPDWVPPLDRALVTCAGSVVNVEVKNLPGDPGYDPEERTATALAGLVAAGGGPGPWPAGLVVSSFWPGSLAAFASAEAHAGATAGGGGSPARAPTPLGLLVHPALDASSSLEVAAGLGCAALHPHHSRVDRDLVGRTHDRGMAVVTWTVNSPGQLEAVVGAGVDVVITDVVADTLRELGRY